MTSLIRAGSLKVGQLVSSVAGRSRASVYIPTTGRKQLNQIIPKELVIAIFQAAADIIINHVIIYDPWADPHRDMSTILRGAQGILFNAILGCKAWYNIGISHLYSHPCLLSSHSMALFARTLKSHSKFPSLVQFLYILDQDAGFPSFEYAPGYGNDTGYLDSYKSRSTRAALHSVLDTCKTEDLFLNLRNTKFTTMFTSEVFAEHVAHVKRLTLFGFVRTQHADWLPSPLAIPEPSMNLPLLTVLCLREVRLGIPNHFPPYPLPSLHTLQIIRSDVFPQDDLVIQTANMPSLKSLGLYQNHGRIILDDVGIQAVEDLTLVGPEELQSFSDWTLSGKLESSVKHLTLGSFWNTSEYVEVDNWRLPSKLETLTLCIQLGHDHYPHPNPIQMVEKLFAFLKLSEMWCFVKLTIYLIPHYMPGARQGYESVAFGLDNIGLLCRARKISFDVQERSESF